MFSARASMQQARPENHLQNSYFPKNPTMNKCDWFLVKSALLIILSLVPAEALFDRTLSLKGDDDPAPCTNTDLIGNATDRGCGPRGQCVDDDGKEVADHADGTKCVRYLLMVPDSKQDVVLTFDRYDGSLVDNNFINGTELGFKTPLHSWQVDDSVYVLDQVSDAIFEFDLDGDFVDLFVNASGVDNMKSIAYHNGLFYVPNGGANNDAPEDAIIVFDVATKANLGSFNGSIVNFSPQHTFVYNDELYVTDGGGSSSDNQDLLVFKPDGVASTVDRVFYDVNGTNDFRFAAHISIRESSGNFLVSAFSGASGFRGGAHEFDPTGNRIGVFRPGVPIRAAYELQNGNILWSSGDGTILSTPDGTDYGFPYVIMNDANPDGTLDFRPSVRKISPLTLPVDLV